ncbi:type II secretion system protein [uncultured Campylobacter sp.]|uniref:type II secretion system protein n=1 Tax=uncultured Campylobacter sp. TaxID=218934 RepID=UPI002607978F|nr:prepilin-type N-terminal cleavage/methylation domain-containing protein [uncultured Campylobacter sp.]
MRKGFTMIELIFVIVILGILAAVAIPRLTATRDDAEVSAAATNIATLMSDINAYFTSQGRVSRTIADMTSVPNPIAIRGNNCLTLVPPANVNEREIAVNIGDAGLCADVWGLPSVSAIRTYLEGVDGGKAANTIRVGGLAVVR